MPAPTDVVRHPVAALAALFVALAMTAAVRAAPAVLMLPLTVHFGWSRTTVATAMALGLLLHGLAGPFAAERMQTHGMRRTMLAGAALMAVGSAAGLATTGAWQFTLAWGIVSGVGSGIVAAGFTVAASRSWFARRGGLTTGVLSAGGAAGGLVLMPVFAWLSADGSWRPATTAVTLACVALIPLIIVWIPAQAPRALSRERTIASSATAADLPTLGLLFATFFVCGATTRGLVGTHMIAMCGDLGIGPVQAVGVLAAIAWLEFAGAPLAGWMTDRWDPRRLLVWSYGVRAAALLLLPLAGPDPAMIGLFGAILGLSWAATIPATAALARRSFGDRASPRLLGWIMAGHPIGAAVGAIAGGAIRDVQGGYGWAFVGSGILAIVVAVALAGTRRPRESGHPIAA